MKRLGKIGAVNLDEYNVKVNPYLTYAQIQQIVDAVKNFTVWAEREQNIDMLILYHATNIGKEKLEEYGHDMLLQSGLIDAVKENIHNLDDVWTALDYTTSIQRSLVQIINELPKYEDVMKRVGDKVKK